MAPSMVYLPNGQSISILPVFGGLFFKSNDLNLHDSPFPAGWTINLHSEDYSDDHPGYKVAKDQEGHHEAPQRHLHTHRYRTPTLQGDTLFISSISNASNNEFKPPTSPTRLIAMMLWATLYWYFHQPEPPLFLTTEASKDTPEAGRPKGDWRIKIKREGVFRGRNLLQKLERMGLISSEDSSVGTCIDSRDQEGWTQMFVSRRSFWQLPATLFLFTLSPAGVPTLPGTPFSISPYGSRPSSPIHNNNPQHLPPLPSEQTSPGVWSPDIAGPFASGSHLPTYYPPPPPQYTNTNGVAHPIRPKPPRQGELFYTRYIPSVEQYISFRVASLSDSPVVYIGPKSTSNESAAIHSPSPIPSHVFASANVSKTTHKEPVQDHTGASEIEDATTLMSDVELLHKWMNDDRVAAFWGCSGAIDVQRSFLKSNLESRHSFPVIGCWDGKPFGYFEIYWVKEDILGRHLKEYEVNEWDRGVHVLVGEQKFRGKHRVNCWLSSLVHWALTSDYRTSSVVLEPRVDNERFIQHLTDAGFSKEREIAFPHKQSAFMRFRRGTYDGPVI